MNDAVQPVRCSPTTMLGRKICTGAAGRGRARDARPRTSTARRGCGTAVRCRARPLRTRRRARPRRRRSRCRRSARAPAPLAELGQLEHVPRAVHVHLARLPQRQGEGDRGGAMDDAGDRFRERLPLRLRESRAPARSMSARSAKTRSRWASRRPKRHSRVSPTRSSASAASRARTATWIEASVRSRYRARISIPTKPVAPVSRTDMVRRARAAR